MIDPRRDGFSGKAAISVTVARPTRVIWLHGLGLTQVEARVEAGGESIATTYTEVDPVTGVVRLDLQREVAAGAATLRFSYAGTYRDGSEGLFLITVGEHRYVFSQFQAIDARRVFPGFDEPGFKTPFAITVIAAEGDEVVTNTPLVASDPAGDGRLAHRFETTAPLPTYLLAFAVGPLDVVDAPAIRPNAIRERPLPLRGVATRGNGPQLAFALAQTADMVERLERYFGLPFPYPKLDLIASPSLGGAMENAGAIVYDESALLVADDAPPAQLRYFGQIHAHELAHQWFGDLVTPTWWDDTWLNESFASWMGYRIAAAWRPQLYDGTDIASDAFATMDLDSRAAGRPVREPLTDSRQITSTFDAITYQKGGGVLAMFESYLGEDVFRRGVRLHLQRHLHGSATSDDFFRALADGSGKPALVEAFRTFVEQPGVPLVSAVISPDRRRLNLSQVRYRPLGVSYPAPQAWKIPVCVTVYGDDAPARHCTLLENIDGELALPPGMTAVMPNAGGAGYYRFALDEQALDRLVALAATLPDTEALALVDSVAAAFRAGHLSFEWLKTAATRLATHPNRRVALALGDELVELRNRWAGPSQRAAMASALAEIYAPRLAELGLDPGAGVYGSEDTPRRLLRSELARMLAIDADHAPTQAILATAAKRSLQEPAALDPEFRAVAWTVGVRQFGAKFAAAMTDRVLDSPDPQVRGAAAAALGAAEDPELAAAALELTIRPIVRVNEMFTIAFRQLGQPATRDAAWEWLQPHFGQFTGKLPGFAQDIVYALPASFCEVRLRDSAATFMAKAATESRASPLRVARTLESIDLCIAQRDALNAQVQLALGLSTP